MGTFSDRIFTSLDDLTLDGSTTKGGAAGSIDQGVNTDSIAESKRISASTSDKAYRKLVASENVTSYSKLSLLHTCPRKYELDEYEANSPVAIAISETDAKAPNLDFCFGHAVGAGIQTYAATRSLVAAQFAAFLAWKAPWDAEKIDSRGNFTGKSLHWAELAVEKFGFFYQQQMDDFEVVRLPNGKPATELSFAIDFENGFWHFGHIDTVLMNKITGKLAVWEGKTTGFEQIDEAIYANSSQALSYSVVVDAIGAQLGVTETDYEVFYIVYSSKTREFQLMPFGKTRAQRAEWLQDMLLNHSNISTYRKLNFFPKRGESCYSYSFRSRCKWFGNCTMKTESLFPGVTLRKLENVEEVEHVDFKFTLSELIAAQRKAS
jgi:hypothetical protein